MKARTSIRSGRCWIPPEWRAPLGTGLLRRSAVIAVAGARDTLTAREVLAAHLPLLAVDDDEELPDPELPGIPDDAAARRMARRLSRYFPAAGTRELRQSGLIAPHVPAVYAWRSARHGEHVFRIAPDGTFTAVAHFRVIRAQDEHGRWDSELVAARPW